MTIWNAILLGLVQGIAEFLPISSSGHLAILQNFLRIGDLENQMLFDVLLHLGTLGAVILAYHTELRGLCREGLAMLHIKKLRRGVKPDLPRRRLLLFLIAATLPLIPAALLNDWLDPLFYNTFFIGFALIVTGFLLLAADRFGHGNKTEKAMTLSDAIIIGLAQMIAVVPGLSRSGTTISAGLLRGFDRTRSASRSSSPFPPCWARICCRSSRPFPPGSTGRRCRCICAASRRRSYSGISPFSRSTVSCSAGNSADFAITAGARVC